ncbi:MAG: hypothetical protein QM765_29395 [Myxococcales bacterium]
MLGLLALRAWQTSQALHMKAGPLETARPGGMVHVMGRVAPSEHLLTSPMLGKECVFFRHSVSYYTPATADEPAHESESVLAEDRTDFVIEDSTGRVLIAVAGARFVMETDFSKGERCGPEPKSRNLLGLEFPADDDRPTRTELETFLEPGDLVRVVGRAHGSAPRTDTEDPAMVVSKKGSTVFVISDKEKGTLLDGYSQRVIVYGAAAGFLFGTAVLCTGISFMPTPEEDPVPVDRTMKPIQRVKRPSAD